MEKETKPKRKQKWNSDSLDGALLFLIFHKRLYHPDSYSSSEIYHEERFPFKEKYNAKNFRTYCQTAANRAKKFKRHGNLSGDFLGIVKEAKKKFADVLAVQEPPELDSADEGSDYEGNSDSDSNLSYDEEESLSALLRDADIDPRQKDRKLAPAKKAKKQVPLAKEHPRVKKSVKEKEQLKPKPNPITRRPTMMQDNTLTKQLIELSGSRLFCRYHLPQYFEGDFIISDDAREIYVEREFRKSMFGAYAARETTRAHCGEEHHNHVLQSALTDELEKLWNRLKELGDTTDDPSIISVEPRGESIMVKSRLFVLPFPVLPMFFDIDNKPEDPVVDEMASGEWCTFVLHKAGFTSPGRSKIRRRRRNMDEGNNGMHERDEEAESYAQEEQRRRTGFPWQGFGFGGNQQPTVGTGGQNSTDADDEL